MELEADPDLKYLKQHGIHFLFDRIVGKLAQEKPLNVVDFLVEALQQEKEKTYKLVLLRHGESTWNKENRFTGWTDVDLAESGMNEAHRAGDELQKNGFEFDVAFTSTLKRAIRTLWVTMDTLDQMYIPVNKLWQLNERHYGALQGLNKAETAARHGDEQVKIWRRSFDVPPPLLDESDDRWPGKERAYKSIPHTQIPKAESLKDTIARVIPIWHKEIAPTIKSGQRVIIVAHGNSLRALVKYLDSMSESDIVELNIPTGVPLVYELDGDLRPKRHYYLGDSEAIKAAEAKVAAQGTAAKA
eukprot:TRINITY_DN102899_c0_g1_i1.p1 TRINITY_DN102899_c0_g1~~TRINITY_DN102899_c0_g1_i1.p1  ORF type:complete len:301 (+),score=25.70 TRINITY_DN102899_c0_g1_i1:126-1028(+)